MKAMVVDLSHFDTVKSYQEVKDAGVVGVIYKATQGSDYQDTTYARERGKAVVAGLKWGAYHFADASDVNGQVDNFIKNAAVDPATLFALDFEEYTDSTMSVEQAREFIEKVEQRLGREGQCVLYSGNLIKEGLGNKVDEFFGSRRLWLAQYGSQAVVQSSWTSYWLWQYTGDGVGPLPHGVPGISGEEVDCNYYAGTAEMLAEEWASGVVPPIPVPPPIAEVVTITIEAPPGITVKVKYSGSI